MADLLPPAPRRLSSRYTSTRTVGAIALMLGAIGVALGYGIWQIDSAQQILRDGRVWAEAKGSSPAIVDGHVTTHDFVLDSYKLKVTFSDQDGKKREGETEFETLFTSVDQNAPAEVHYAIDHPDQFALNWAIDVTGGRWMAFAFMAIIGVFLIGGSLAFLGYKLLSTTRAASRAALQGVEAICAVTLVEQQIVQGKTTGRLIYHYALPEHLARGGA
jgi:hypothetical protein